MKIFETSDARPEFDRLTGFDSRSLVAGVVQELRLHFGTEPPAELEAELLRRLLTFFALHGCWRARILRKPDPEFVNIFLRRWASELLFHHRRALYEGLPRGYRTGGPLPPSRQLPLNLDVEPVVCAYSPATVA
jgi:hypothetical protein